MASLCIISKIFEYIQNYNLNTDVFFYKISKQIWSSQICHVWLIKINESDFEQHAFLK